MFDCPSTLSQATCSSQHFGRAIGQFVRCCLPLLVLLSGCMPTELRQLELTIRVDPADRPGVYNVSGNTNLPDRTPIIVQGVRSFGSATQLNSAGSPSTYSILARQSTEVSQGKWQATLNLWQVAPDGQYREAWQLNQTQTMPPPKANVTFMVTTKPAYESKILNQQLVDQGKTLQSDSIHFTSAGEWYLQAQQALAISLPTGKTTPPVLSADDLNGAWGKRSELPKTDVALPKPGPATRSNQTTAPLSPAQRLR